MRICLMVEGQEDVSWDQWLALAGACERAGLEGLFRSDHYTSVMGQEGRGSLDAWATVTALAQATTNLRLGTLVSPATFRHPSVLAKMVVTADHMAPGRIELGIGAGWLEAEHRAYGFTFPPTSVRMEILEEQTEIIHRSWSRGPFSFHGRHYTVDDLDALPKAVGQPHPNLIVGGHAGPRTAKVAARWADEYNTTFASPAVCRQRRGVVAEAWGNAGRDAETLVFSLMTRAIIGADDADVAARARAVQARTGDVETATDAWLGDHRDEWVVGTVADVVTQLRRYEDAGVERVMLQHLAHDDLAMVELLAEVAHRLA